MGSGALPKSPRQERGTEHSVSRGAMAYMKALLPGVGMGLNSQFPSKLETGVRSDDLYFVGLDSAKEPLSRAKRGTGASTTRAESTSGSAACVNGSQRVEESGIERKADAQSGEHRLRRAEAKAQRSLLRLSATASAPSAAATVDKVRKGSKLEGDMPRGLSSSTVRDILQAGPAVASPFCDSPLKTDAVPGKFSLQPVTLSALSGASSSRRRTLPVPKVPSKLRRVVANMGGAAGGSSALSTPRSHLKALRGRLSSSAVPRGVHLESFAESLLSNRAALVKRSVARTVKMGEVERREWRRQRMLAMLSKSSRRGEDPRSSGSALFSNGVGASDEESSSSTPELNGVTEAEREEHHGGGGAESQDTSAEKRAARVNALRAHRGYLAEEAAKLLLPPSSRTASIGDILTAGVAKPSPSGSGKLLSSAYWSDFPVTTPHGGRAAPPLDVRDTEMKLEKLQRKERLDKWFGLPLQERTPETLMELKALQLRGFADPKTFYKRPGRQDKLPSHFHFARIVDGGLQAVGGGAESQARGTVNARKKSGQSLTQQLLLGSKDSVDWTKRRYVELQQSRASGGKGWFRNQQRKRRHPALHAKSASKKGSKRR